MKEIKKSIHKFSDAFEKLKQGVQNAKDELDRDGVIQRFEFTFELFWKTLKRILDYEGIKCGTPRQCIKEAFRLDVIVDDQAFLDMLGDRNISSHVYDEEKVTEIFNRIKDQYVDHLKKAKEKFEEYK